MTLTIAGRNTLSFITGEMLASKIILVGKYVNVYTKRMAAQLSPLLVLAYTCFYSGASHISVWVCAEKYNAIELNCKYQFV